MGLFLNTALVVIIANMGWSLTAFAGLGDELVPSQIPPSVCMLALETSVSTTGSANLQATCSGVMISPTQLLTAGHCIDNIDLEKAQVHCPLTNGPVKIANVTPASDYKTETVTFHEEERWRDVAIVTLKNPVVAPMANLVKNQDQIQRLLAQSNECAFFGFSTRLGRDLTPRMLAQGIRLSPQAIRISNSKTIWVDGQAQPVSLVGPGDSGGGLACRQNQEWVFFGITSARDYNYGGIFANIGVHQKFISDLRKSPSSAHNEHRARNMQAVLKTLEEEKCWKKLESKAGMRTQQTCQQGQIEFIKTHLDQKYKVKPYSEVLVDGTPMSTVDHKYTQFSILKVEGNIAIGELNLLGYSEGFGCLPRFLCRQGVYKNTRIPLDRLDLN